MHQTKNHPWKFYIHHQIIAETPQILPNRMNKASSTTLDCLVVVKLISMLLTSLFIQLMKSLSFRPRVNLYDPFCVREAEIKYKLLMALILCFRFDRDYFHKNLASLHHGKKKWLIYLIDKKFNNFLNPSRYYNFWCLTFQQWLMLWSILRKYWVKSRKEASKIQLSFKLLNASFI